MRRFRFGGLLALAAVMFSSSGLACDGQSATEKFNGLRPFIASGAVGFVKKRLAVDADGAPNSYQVDGKGLSYTCDGVVAIVNGQRSTPVSDPDHWQGHCVAAWKLARQTGDYSKLAIFGFAKDSNNVPIVQGEGDPLPSLGYISETTMPVPDGPTGTQRHWVNALEIPFVVLSSSFVNKFDIRQGDVAVVYRPSNDTMAFAIYADGGGLGEGSVRLHRDLKNNPIVKINGVERAKREISGENILTLVFPGKGTRASLDLASWRKEITEIGKAALAEWGGVARLRSCANAH